MGYFYRKSDNESLNKLYELLEDVTPLSHDCGALCGGACCQGGGGDGMLLFPGEEALFSGKAGFTVSRDDRYACSAVVCAGDCDRTERPLSCRIYPYFFYVAKNGSVSVAADVRALGRCPLTTADAPISRVFLRRMRMSAKIIENDKALYEHIVRIAGLLTDFGALDKPDL